MGRPHSSLNEWSTGVLLILECTIPQTSKKVDDWHVVLSLFDVQISHHKVAACVLRHFSILTHTWSLAANAFVLSRHLTAAWIFILRKMLLYTSFLHLVYFNFFIYLIVKNFNILIFSYIYFKYFKIIKKYKLKKIKNKFILNDTHNSQYWQPNTIVILIW